MKIRIEIWLAFLLAGCAAAPEQAVMQERVVDEVQPAQVVDAGELQTSIDPSVLYLLLAAEIAGQRNQYHVALDGYLQAARLVNDPRVAERAARIGLYVKDSERTDEAVQLWLEQDPANLTARRIALLSSMRKSDRAESGKHLQKILDNDPAGLESVLAELAQLMEKEGKMAFLYDVMDQVSVDNPDNATLLFMQAVVASKMNKKTVAREKNSQVLMLQPEWTRALMLEAQLAGQAGDMGAARQSLEQALDLESENQQIRKFLAQLLVEEKEYDEAIELYRQILQSKKDDGESRFAIALIYLQQDELDKAEKELAVLVHDPNWVSQASFYMGRIEYERKNWDKALVWFDKVNNKSLAFDAQLAAFSLLLERKDYEAAAERIASMERRFPRKKTRIQLLKAEMHSEAGDIKQAFNLLTVALTDSPENRDLLYSRAIMAERLDRLDVLEADLKQILQSDPDDAGALNALGYTLADRTDRYEEAKIYLQRALQLEPDEAVIIDSYGWLLYKMGQIEDARKYIEKAYAKNQEPEIAAHLAEVLWVMGEKDAAEAVFEEAWKRSPGDRFLESFRRRFLLQAN